MNRNTFHGIIRGAGLLLLCLLVNANVYGEVADADQPCNDCPQSPWSLPYYTEVFVQFCNGSGYAVIDPGASTTVYVKYRQRYNSCLDRYEFYIEWIEFPNVYYSLSSGCRTVNSLADLLELVRLEMIDKNPMKFPPFLQQDEGNCYSIVSVYSACWGEVQKPDCPVQVMECFRAPCCKVEYEVCMDSEGVVSFSETPLNVEYPSETVCNGTSEVPGITNCQDVCPAPPGQQ